MIEIPSRQDQRKDMHKNKNPNKLIEFLPQELYSKYRKLENEFISK